MPKHYIAREDFRLLYNKIIKEIKPESDENQADKSGLLPDSDNRSEFYGSVKKYETNSDSVNFQIVSHPKRVKVFESNEWIGPYNFGANLLQKRLAWEKGEKEIMLEECYFVAFYLFVIPTELSEKWADSDLEIIRNGISDYQATLVIEDMGSPAEVTENIEKNFYACFYYSAIIYGVKRFGFSLTFAQNKEIIADEWGYHNVWREEDKYDKFLAFEDGVLEEGTSIKLSDFIPNSNTSQIVENIEYSGSCIHDQDTLYCNLTKIGGKNQMNFILKAPTDFITLRDKSQILKGIMQTKSEDDGGLISLEVIMIKVKNQSDALPLDVSSLDTHGIKQIDLNTICLYLMFQRRLLRVNNQVISELSSLKAKGVQLAKYLKFLPGVYRVWNLGMNGNLVQSRIVITEDFRIYLIPFFRETDQIDKYRAQWCLFNINGIYTDRISIVSHVGLSHVNHAIIDLSLSFQGENIYVGIFSSVGHDKTRTDWAKGGVLGGYMVVKKEDILFKVQEFEIGSKDFETYVEKYNLKRFYKAFSEVITIKYSQVKSERIKQLENKLKFLQGQLDDLHKSWGG